MGKDTFRYIGLCLLIYLGIALIQIFFGDILIDFVFRGFWSHLYVHIFLLLFIDPVLTGFLLSRFKWHSSKDSAEQMI